LTKRKVRNKLPTKIRLEIIATTPVLLIIHKPKLVPAVMLRMIGSVTGKWHGQLTNAIKPEIPIRAFFEDCVIREYSSIGY